jgi:hypothetical protein
LAWLLLKLLHSKPLALVVNSWALLDSNLQTLTSYVDSLQEQ